MTMDSEGVAERASIKARIVKESVKGLTKEDESSIERRISIVQPFIDMYFAAKRYSTDTTVGCCNPEETEPTRRVNVLARNGLLVVWQGGNPIVDPRIDNLTNLTEGFTTKLELFAANDANTITDARLTTRNPGGNQTGVGESYEERKLDLFDNSLYLGTHDDVIDQLSPLSTALQAFMEK